MELFTRIMELADSKGVTMYIVAKETGISQATLSRLKNQSTNKLNRKNILALAEYFHVRPEWLLTGMGEKEIPAPKERETDYKREGKRGKTHLATTLETRPRIPMNAAAGSVSVAMSGVTNAECEQLPVIRAFSNYNFTIMVSGDSMEPEFHRGDEVACLQITESSFIQWGRYHVLDTSQGILIKRVYDDGDHVLCKSELSELYSDFKIHKSEIYNIALVVGMIRRY